MSSLQFGANPWRPCLLALASSISCASLQAQTAPDTPQQVEITGTVPRAYATLQSSTGTKSDTPLLDTAMSVQAVPSAVIRDQRATSALDAVRQLSGVQSEPGSFYDQFQIRGFGSGYGVSFRNGLQLEGVADTVDMSFVDRIEVIKGPASMLYGRVEPGGFVNVVTRRPTRQAALSVEAGVSRWSGRDLALDATGALGESGAWRLMGHLDQGDDYYPNQHRDRKAMSAALSGRDGERFEWNASLELYDHRGAGRGPNAVVPAVGNRPDASVPRDASATLPVLWSDFPDRIRRQLLAVDWTWRLGERWKLTQRAHLMHVDEVQTGLSDWGGGSWGFIYNPLQRHVFNINLDLSGTETWAGVTHELLIGADHFRYRDHWRGYVGDTGISTAETELAAPLQALVDESRANVLWTSFESDTGLYLQDRIVLDETWSVLLGGRWDSGKARYADTYGAGGLYAAPCYPNCSGAAENHWPADHAFSPRAAVLAKLDASTSFYASFSKSFGMNNSSWLSSGSFAPPEKGTQYELGVKKHWLDDRLVGSATLFELTKSNVLAEDPNNRLQQIAIGEIRSHGLELDLAGQLTPQWSLVASYTFDSVIITKDTNTDSNQGKRKAGTPLRAASLWAKYVPGGLAAREGWSFAGGVKANGQRQGDNANSWQMPGYAVIDLMAAYRTRWSGHGVEAQLNLKNALDRAYFDQISYGNASWGTPRSAALTLRVEW